MSHFTEAEFEKWFCNEQCRLPNERSRKLILLAKHVPLRRNVDLLFFNPYDCSLVLIEVKNETATVRAIGQLLEYLSQFEGLDFEGMIEDFRDTNNNGDLDARLARLKKSNRALTDLRHIIIAAPDFDFETMATCALLNERFKNAKLRVSLMKITRRKGRRLDFETKFVEIESPRPVRQLHGKHVLNRGGRLYYVLDINNENLVLNVGKLKRGHFRRPETKTRTQRLVTRKRNRRFVEYEGEEYRLDLSRQGTWWEPGTGNYKPKAVILGESQGENPKVYLAFDRPGDDRKRLFSIRDKEKFDKRFSVEVSPPQDWRRLVRRNVEYAEYG